MELLLSAIAVGQLSVITLLALRAAFRRPPKPVEYNGNQIELTTKLPVSFAAQTCTHEWEEVSKVQLDGQFEKKFILILKCKDCGTIDKTVESVQPTCKHDWSSQEVTVKSAHEQMATSSYYQPQKPSSDNAWVWGKQTVLVRSCTHCGETHETKVENTAFGMKPPQGQPLLPSPTA
jgi:Zn finger protein HypA/HybF involved in hydrogenase expression